MLSFAETISKAPLRTEDGHEYTLNGFGTDVQATARTADGFIDRPQATRVNPWHRRERAAASGVKSLPKRRFAVLYA